MNYLLLTLAAQIGSAVYNSVKGNKQANELADKQRELEKKITLDGINNAREEYAQICALQREIETQMHRDRLGLITENHRQNILTNAYSVALSNWPLLVPPYIIKKDTIFESGMISEMSSLPLNCILTTSTCRKFNNHIFIKLEENIATFCSNHWNLCRDKSVRFYQSSWRHNTTDVGSRIYDLYTHLKDIPTLVLSPFVSDNGIVFKFYWWGISQNPDDVHINNSSNIYDPKLSIKVTDDFKYSSDDVNQIINELSTKLSAFISYFGDLYYWNCYNMSPSLPGLIKDGILELDAQSINEYALGYTKTINSSQVPGHLSEIVSFIDTLSAIQSPGEFSTLASEKIQEVTSRSIVSVPEMCSLNRFNSVYGIRAIADTLDTLSEKEVEVVEAIEFESLNDKVIKDFASTEMAYAYNPSCFAYIYWNKSVAIGTFCNSDGDPAIFSESNTTCIFILTDKQPTYKDELGDEVIVNIINLLKDNSMELKRTRKIREQLGKKLCMLGERLQKEASSKSETKSPWDTPQNEPQTQVDELAVITNHFIKGVDNSTVAYTFAGNDMSLELVLNWLDSLDDASVGNNNQVYVIKSKHTEKNTLIYCVFLAQNDRFNLNLSPKHCYICNAEAQEMQDLFGEKRVYVIPFEN